MVWGYISLSQAVDDRNDHIAPSLLRVYSLDRSIDYRIVCRNLNNTFFLFSILECGPLRGLMEPDITRRHYVSGQENSLLRSGNMTPCHLYTVRERNGPNSAVAS